MNKMTEHAPPIFEQCDQDHKCYNCGMTGHLFYACPEDARRVPAGLEASRKRQNPIGEKHASKKRNKGPVVTHYPVPPSGGPSYGSFPPPPTYDSQSSQEIYYPSQPQGPPIADLHRDSYEQYPPPGTGRGMPHQLPYDGLHSPYEHHPYSGRQGPPKVPHEYRHDDRFDHHRPGSSFPPPPPQIHPSYSPRYTDYPPGMPHDPPSTYNPPPPQAPYSKYPPPPGVSNYAPGSHAGYPPPPPPAYNGPLPAPYSQSHHPMPAAPFPHQPHPLPPPPHPMHTHYHPDDHYPDRSYESSTRDDRWQHDDDRSSRHRHHRGHENNRHRRNSPRGHGPPERRARDKPARIPSPARPTAQNTPPNENSNAANSRAQKNFKESHISDDHKSKNDSLAADSEWDEKTIFNEPDLQITKDLIREPLPAEWTDDPLMPPKYGKECVTSRYVTETNVDDFSLSVRETRAWKILQYHPIFRPLGDCRIKSLKEYQRALIPGKQVRQDNRQRPRNSASRSHSGQHDNFPPQLNGHVHIPESRQGFIQFAPRKRSWDQSHIQDAAQTGEPKPLPKKTKVSSPEPGEVLEGNEEQNFEPDDVRTIKASKGGQSYLRWKDNKNHNNRNIHTLRKGRDQLNHKSPLQSPLRASSPPFSPSPPTPLPRHSRSPSPHSVQSRPSSGQSSGSPHSKQSSRHSSPGSPLTPNERELLGLMSDESDTEQDSPPPPRVPTPKPKKISDLKPKKRAPKTVAAAYQRRW
ncbi:hypothetical protein F5Y16DRAFT_863 [Xylariaceae sp. FL0255]|nr:hypothetical protein F5Y16DRAFT_863 [Xylariaceae sp. FL0255]